MTSIERHERRYARRKAARENKRKERTAAALDFDDVFTFVHMYNSAQMCFKGVKWKASVQAYRARCGINVARKMRELKSGELSLRKCPEFYIRERGHLRRINSIHIEDRVPQKCNSMYSLKPVLHPTLIYDNYASQNNKGTSLARSRIKCMLERHIRRHGMTGGVLIFDFRHFFDSIRHSLARETMERYYSDSRMIDFNMRVVRQCREDVGLVLGSENSQDFAISTPSAFDHYITERVGVEAYGRFMDDGIIIDEYERLKDIFEMMKEFAARLGFTLNERKTRLLHFGQQFTILKRKYDFTASGKIIIRPAAASVVRERRKLKKLHKKFLAGEITINTCVDSVTAWKSSIEGTRSARVVMSMGKLYDRLLIYPWLVGEEEREKCTTKSYRTARLSMSQAAA